MPKIHNQEYAPFVAACIEIIRFYQSSPLTEQFKLFFGFGSSTVFDDGIFGNILSMQILMNDQIIHIFIFDCAQNKSYISYKHIRLPSTTTRAK